MFLGAAVTIVPMKNILVSVWIAVLGTGCASFSMGVPLNGFLFNGVSTGIAATSNQAGNRVGEACASSILGLVAMGDSTIETARRNGGITLITSVDNSFTSILGLYASYCTHVRGR